MKTVKKTRISVTQLSYKNRGGHTYLHRGLSYPHILMVPGLVTRKDSRSPNIFLCEGTKVVLNDGETTEVPFRRFTYKVFKYNFRAQYTH